MNNTKEKLFSEFQAPTTQEWLDKIEVDLKGADFQKRLVWRTAEGFNVQPFYRREDVEKLQTPYALPGEYPFLRGNKKDDNTWYIYIFATRNEFQRQGHGKKLIKLLCSFADINGYRICLETNLKENVTMYENFGFKNMDSSIYKETLEHYVMLYMGEK